MTAEIHLHPYNPGWPAEFAAICADLRACLGPLALRIDHIGSTAVPGLGAKDIIDIQITVKALAGEIVDKLVAARYAYRPDLTHDHVPPGEPDDPVLWAKFVFKERPGRRRANIHVRAAGKPNQRYALLFRDYLRAHPSAAQAIEIAKRELAARHPRDADAYYAVKDPVYDLVWTAAKEWADQTGWPAAIEPGLGEKAPAIEAAERKKLIQMLGAHLEGVEGKPVEIVERFTRDAVRGYDPHVSIDNVMQFQVTRVGWQMSGGHLLLFGETMRYSFFTSALHTVEVFPDRLEVVEHFESHTARRTVLRVGVA